MSPLNFFESNSLKFKFQGRRRRFQNILNGDKNKIYFIFINIEPIPREMRSIKDLFIFSFLSFGNFDEFWDHKSSQNEDIWAQNVCRVIVTLSGARNHHSVIFSGTRNCYFVRFLGTEKDKKNLESIQAHLIIELLK